jgi:hypothetical protein
MESDIVPAAHLGLVIWIDNQYAAWGVDGRLHWGMLANPTLAWIEVGEVECSST